MTDRTAVPTSGGAAPEPGRGPAPGAPAAVDRPVSVAVWAFAGWTLFVWVGRIRNAFADPDLDAGGRTGPVLLSAVFVAGALVVLGSWWAARRRPAARRLLARAVFGLALWTAGVWLVRAVDIALLGDHDAAFVAVHLVLAAGSVGLAAWAWRAVGLPWGRWATPI